MKFTQAAILAVVALSASSNAITTKDTGSTPRSLRRQPQPRCVAGEIKCKGSNKFLLCNSQHRYQLFQAPTGWECESIRGQSDDLVKYITVEATNIAFQQPLSSFFVATHNDDVELYQMGQPSTQELAILAEDGNPSALVDAWSNNPNVGEAYTVQGPVLPGQSLSFPVKLSYKYPRLSLASMTINTNDCFVALNGKLITDDEYTLMLPGLDAGSEENNELCSSIPGPACAPTSGNVRSGNGEGFVHVHRGFHGINEGESLDDKDNGGNGQPLSAVGYDWRNPMVRLRIQDAN